MKIGELAKRIGVSVRTLHYYNEIGLLVPSHRTESGYRVYTESDIMRLQLIRSLQHLGLSLQEIQEIVLGNSHALLDVIPLHVARVKKQIEIEQSLVNKLEMVHDGLKRNKNIPAEKFLQILNLMTLTDSYFTPEQLKKIKKRGHVIGKERIREVENRWPVLISKVKAEMQKGTDPKSEVVQKLAKEWKSLVEEFTGGDPGVTASLKKMYEENGSNLSAQYGEGVPNMEMMKYIQKAMGDL